MSKRPRAPTADGPARNEATPPPPEPAQEAEPYRPEKPVHQVRMGHIRAAIWANVNASGTWYNVTFARLYKDGGEWKSSDHYGRDDLLLLAKVADRVHSWIYQQQQLNDLMRPAQARGPATEGEGTTSRERTHGTNPRGHAFSEG